MRFFTPKEDFTHYGRFYGVPVYMALYEDEDPTIAGTNLVFDYLFQFAVWFHNFFIERFAQFGASITGQDYEPGFPIKLWDFEGEGNEEK